MPVLPMSMNVLASMSAAIALSLIGPLALQVSEAQLPLAVWNKRR